MEPMALGSPPSSPVSPGVAPHFLPSFLMGDTQPATPNPNISPGRNRSNLKVNFSSTPTDPKNLRQKLFNQSLNDTTHLMQSPYNNLQMERNGPPKQGLFDTMENKTTPVISRTMQRNNENALSMDESYYSQAANNLNESLSRSYMGNNQSVRYERGDTLWVTVFGFPPSVTSLVLAQLMNCGSIVDKKFPTQGNWVHLKYSSLHEAAKALTLNGKLISNNTMIGVVPYYNKQDKENIDSSGMVSPIRARSLRHTAVSPQNSNTVIPQNVPQKSTGLVTKAIEYVFGW